MKYYSKSDVFEAFQMTQERWKDDFEWPEWFSEARWVTAKGTLGSFQTKEGRLELNTTKGPVTMEVGDWIIRGSGDELRLCTDDGFRAKYKEVYEKVYEEVQQPQLRQSVPKGTDETVWLNIYCAALNKPDTLAEHALLWADKGLKEFRDRFH